LFFIAAGILVISGVRTDAVNGVTISDSVLKTIFGLILGLIGLAAYFIPSIIASSRRHKERWPIFLVNLLLGCSVIGWIVALIWSCSSQVEDSKSQA
jgi:uncharacterized membrane protein YfcA